MGRRTAEQLSPPGVAPQRHADRHDAHYIFCRAHEELAGVGDRVIQAARPFEYAREGIDAVLEIHRDTLSDSAGDRNHRQSERLRMPRHLSRNFSVRRLPVEAAFGRQYQVGLCYQAVEFEVLHDDFVARVKRAAQQAGETGA